MDLEELKRKPLPPIPEDIREQLKRSSITLTPFEDKNNILKENYYLDNQNKYLGIYLALVAQLDKLARHNRQGSYQTKDRYYRAMKRFCRYLAQEYRL